MKNKRSDILAHIDISRSPDQILNERRATIDCKIANTEEAIRIVKRIESARWPSVENDEAWKFIAAVPCVISIPVWAAIIIHLIDAGRIIRQVPYGIIAACAIVATVVLAAVLTRRFWVPSAILVRRLRAMGVTGKFDTAKDRARHLDFWPKNIEDMKRERASLTLESTVPPLYLETIADIREKTIGPDSRLERARIRTNERCQELCVNASRLQQRLADAIVKNERGRIPSLDSACNALAGRIRAFTATLAEIRELAVGIRTVLDECEARAKGLGGQLGDVDLIRKMEASETADEALLEQTRAAMEATVAEIREKVISLHEAVAAAASSPELAGKEESLDEYLERVEEANEEVAKLLTAKLLTT